MNIFRSEENVKRWPLYVPVVEDYIMPIKDWSQVFSDPLFRNRLGNDYLSKADEYLQEFHKYLRQVSKTSPFWQYPLEKLGLYSVALNERQSNVRQLQEFPVRAVDRIP